MAFVELLPKFASFYRSHILAQHFDYIVPVETKGMLILEKIVQDIPEQSEKILIQRAFDFIGAASLKGKRIALVDDMMRMGRTLEHVAAQLQSKGVSQIRKFVFMRCDDEYTRVFRHSDDVDFCMDLSKPVLDLYLEEISELSRRDRPSSPDHFSVYVSLKDYSTYNNFLGLCTKHADVIEYSPREDYRMVSLHYPDFNPALPKMGRDSGTNKIRIKWGQSGTWMKLYPEFFPALNFDRENPLAGTWTEIAKLLNKEWHKNETETKLKNIYESFTLSIRAKQVGKFLAVCDHAGFEIAQWQLQADRITKYYGPELFAQISAILEKQIEKSRHEGFVQKVNDECEPKTRIDLFELTETLLGALEKEFEAQNAAEDDRFKWRPVGLNIEEAVCKTRLSRIPVSIGLEHLNDYGYSVPHFSSTLKPSNALLQRQYRLTETGAARLHS